MPYITQSGISINHQDLWFYNKAPITNPAVLRYFKQHIRREAKGYYIENRFGEQVEHSYIESVKGFPLIVDSLQFDPACLREEQRLREELREDLGEEQRKDREEGIALKLSLDSGEEIAGSASDLYVSSAEAIIVLLEERGRLAARLSRETMLSLSDWLHQDDRGCYLLTLPNRRCQQPLSALNPEELFYP